jgi:hypothetical protein
VTIIPAMPTAQIDSVVVLTTRMLRMVRPISPGPAACT